MRCSGHDRVGTAGWPAPVEGEDVSDQRAVEDLVVGVLGGTGPQGRGLAVRLAAVGQRILLGSRDAERASKVAIDEIGRASCRERV